MKTTKTLLLRAAIIAALALLANVRADNLAAAAAKAGALVNRPIAASPHALVEFPWLLRGNSQQAEAKRHGKNKQIHLDNPAAAPNKGAASVKRPIVNSTHRGDYP